MAVIDYTCITPISEYSKSIRQLFKWIEVPYYSVLHFFIAQVTFVTLWIPLNVQDKVSNTTCLYLFACWYRSMYFFLCYFCITDMDFENKYVPQSFTYVIFFFHYSYINDFWNMYSLIFFLNVNVLTQFILYLRMFMYRLETANIMFLSFIRFELLSSEHGNPMSHKMWNMIVWLFCYGTIKFSSTQSYSISYPFIVHTFCPYLESLTCFFFGKTW